MHWWVKEKIEIFIGSRISKFLRPAQRYDNFKLIRITCQAACHGKTEHVCSEQLNKFRNWTSLKNRAKLLLSSLSSLKNRAKLLLSYLGYTISGTPCPRHIIVPFGAEAPSGHVAQAWAIPPPSWGLLSQWHRQQTTTPETNEASSARTQQHS